MQRPNPGPPDVRRVSDAREAATILADEIEALAAERRAAGRPLVLGLATGRSPIAIYEELVRRVRAGTLDLSGALAFNLDEYCGLAASDERSFAAWMERTFFGPLAWPRSRRWIPDGALAEGAQARAAEAYERTIREVGGIDLQLLGIGRNGHIGFNEPGSALDSRTRRVELEERTREDAARDFPGASVPRHALTMGVATILEARRVRLLAFGAHKHAALARALRGPVGADCPATFLARHADVRVFADDAALGASPTARGNASPGRRS